MAKVTRRKGFTATVNTPRGPRGAVLQDFYAYLPTHQYLYVPTREMWVATSINNCLPPVPVRDKNGKPKLNKNGKPITIEPSTWLDQNRSVQQVTWIPGRPMLLADQLVSEGGFITKTGATCFNFYRPPSLKLGDARKATPWLALVRKVFPDEAKHIINWLAHRVQRPQEKINHALVLGGAQGIGKDSILEPVKRAVGPWNFHEVSPGHLLGRFNGFAKSTILRVSEGRDLGDVNRFAFYDHCKVYCAAPPDVLRCDEKFLREYPVFNCLGFLFTTNHKTDGLFLPPDDRRHFVAWSPRVITDTTPEEWRKLWSWYGNGGNSHVAAYLTELDLTGFDPAAPPAKTAAFWDVVNASQAPEDGELADVIDALDNPDALTLHDLAMKANGAAAEWLSDRRNRRSIPHRLERCGYVSVRDVGSKEGLWIIGKVRQRIYAKSSLTPTERLQAARELTKGKQ
jgi:hypothetical protein